MDIKRSELRKKYESMKTYDLAKELQTSVPTLLKRLRKYDIPLKKRGKQGNRDSFKVIDDR